MAPTASPGRRKKSAHPHPAHKCAYEPCCNYVVPPAKGRKHRCCSEECLTALIADFHNRIRCRSCLAWFRREGKRVNCPACLATRKQERALQLPRVPLPMKACAWVFCQKQFQPKRHNSKYCSSDCRESGRPGPGYPTSNHGTYASYGSCAGNCGLPVWTADRTDHRCYACEMGTKHGTAQPFGPPLPAGWRRCHWLFCNALYRADSPEQRGCCSLHEQLRVVGAKGWPRHEHLGNSGRRCANNCGAALYDTRQLVCLPCSLGLKYGRVNPFPEDADERTRWGEPVVHLTDNQMAAEWDHLLPPPVPEAKKCQWAFCGEEFVATPGEDKNYCKAACRMFDGMRRTEGAGWESPQKLSDVLCAGGCGVWVPGGAVGEVMEHCYRCYLGHQYGTRNPYPPVPDRGTAAEQGWHVPVATNPASVATGEWDADWEGADTGEWDADWEGADTDEWDADWDDDREDNAPAEAAVKTCAWAFCGQTFVATPGDGQQHCSPECARYDDSTGLSHVTRRGRSYPRQQTDVLCEGGCGLWMPGPVGHLYHDICFACYIGKRFGKRNPYPPVPEDRTAARFTLTEQELAEELDWLTPGAAAASAQVVQEAASLDEDWEWLTPENAPDAPKTMFDPEADDKWGALWRPAPSKRRCAWAFCGEEYRSWAADTHYCSPQCRAHDQRLGRWRLLPIGQGWAYPKERTDVLCAGGCGVWLQGGLLERCFRCEVGRKYGKRNPNPPVPADRTAARYYLSQQQLDAELDWLRPEPESPVPVVLAVLAGLASLVAGGLCAWWAATLGR